MCCNRCSNCSRDFDRVSVNGTGVVGGGTVAGFVPVTVTYRIAQTGGIVMNNSGSGNSPSNSCGCGSQTRNTRGRSGCCR